MAGQNIKRLRHDGLMLMVKEIPDKLFFKIGDASSITGVKPHVLRYWESEFKALRPIKNKAGQRVYRKKDIELIFEIKKLLYEESFTIAGARRKLMRSGAAREDQLPLSFMSNKMSQTLGYLKKELQSILDLIKKNG